MSRKAIRGPKYLIYDGRYRSIRDRALVLETCETLKEAKQRLKVLGDAVIVDAKTGEIVR
ncbi:unnamed protein product [marine sediment metagenome]|uniref:Uncharacterized protein n=1 Tax=marine sediment metagenome TaxID=412755 RepID=X1TSG9_9ZZZZ